ncbi:serine/threonine protein kinase [Desulforamulus reducens MI-1]|uniref:non-specific serine/threonine protein kinase n=1 Tax=Desulforamulus reducens (strain ATCC BAA-1160 / DSM 100696 / MI-1) TaxID=349161 RepID=A4J588_DESRM|nr:Stk1 family PASTA domain-containing Ser/Thr kinase [Desulforamulus reducens]ABO50241.1 serine/threonine protein kinase [Desulforamulus reducens MI-1]
MIGKLLGNRYEILEQLGGGGMALVWKGKDTFLNRLVTIKVLRPEYASDQEFVRRFRREAQAVASLSHPNIVSIYDVGQENESHYLVMEYVDGESLKEMIRREAPLAPFRVIQLGRQIADALEHAHENSIIHRDVKPHNILITRSGRAKLTDFGIAQASASTITHTDTIVGSVHYISPEQAKGEPAGPKSDIYALGVVLYEMLTGQVPYQADGAIGVALKHIQEEPLSLREINPNVPEDLEKVVLRAMDKRQDRRHKSAKALGEDLVSISDETRNMVPYNHEEEYTRVLPSPVIIKNEAKAKFAEEKPVKKKQMKPAAWAMLGLLVLLLLAGSYFALSSYLNVGEVKIPKVTGMKVDKAEKVLKDLGLSVNISKVYHDTIEKDYVISQDPEANEVVKKVRPVTLVVSRGQDLVEVPDVIRLPYDEARLTLLNLQFQVDTPDSVYSNSIEKDRVAEQKPEGKTKAPRGSHVKLSLSQGPEPKMQKVPNLSGLTQEAARAQLASLGLEMDENIDQRESDEYLSGQIVGQEPAPGSDLAEGNKVKVTISTGPGPVAKQMTVTIHVPDDGKTHEVRIETEDVRGRYNQYISTHQPGDDVTRNIRFYGKGKVRVYIDNVLQEEEPIE